MSSRFVLVCLATAAYQAVAAGAFVSVRVLEANKNGPDSGVGWALVALAHGLAISIGMLLLRASPGLGVNPALALAQGALGHSNWRKMPLDVLAQLIGAILGTLALIMTFGQPGITPGRLGAVRPSPGTSLWQAFAIEALGTGVLMLASSASVLNPKTPVDWRWLSLGLTLVVMTMLFGPATGGTMNPARGFGSDLIESLLGHAIDWPGYFVGYVAGPIVGALIAGYVYKRLVRSIPDDTLAQEQPAI